MSGFPEGNAIVYCQGGFGTTNGKTAHGLVRRTERYRVLSVVDARHAGCDAGLVLDTRAKGIMIHEDIDRALKAARSEGIRPTHLVIGLAPDGGRMSGDVRRDVLGAVRLGLNIDSGLHDFLAEDDEISALAAEHGVTLRDIRKTPSHKDLHFFTGRIEEVASRKVAVLGTDSAVGKRTTAWILVDALRAAGCSAELIGTGQTAWMQGARYGIILDSLVNDFVSGEIEHSLWSAWREAEPDVIVVEGQGSLMNPAYPGGFEILAAARPDCVILQHAPARIDYDGFPGYPIHPIARQIEAIEIISGRPVAAVAVNHEGLEASEIPAACKKISELTGLPAVDVLVDGAEELLSAILSSSKDRSPS